MFLKDVHESDNDKDKNSGEDLGEELCETNQEKQLEPKVSITEATLQTAAGIQSELDLRQNRVISLTTDQANCCQKRDAKREQLCELCSGFAYGCVYSPKLNRYLWDPRISSDLFHSPQLNTWHSCANADRAMPCGLSPGVPARTPRPINLQQHALVQVHNMRNYLEAVSNESK